MRKVPKMIMLNDNHEVWGPELYLGKTEDELCQLNWPSLAHKYLDNGLLFIELGEHNGANPFLQVEVSEDGTVSLIHEDSILPAGAQRHAIGKVIEW